ncbi:hypothetical protein FJZ31_23240 [Candidatus Poribacteria bacterium]|nr:hypothetical protein [Candidatus Poribacteria bacterium]
MIGISKEQFIREYSRKVMDGSAALFVGAGLSRPAGYVDWKELLREIADDLGLIVDRECDLIAIAQYHCNQRRSRSKLNEKIIEEFTKDSRPTDNHPLIAQLPIHTVWTTNYDTLIEEAFRAQHKRVDVKISPENVAQSRPGIDVTIFKMHGDVSQPHQAVLTKDDYETYHLRRELFTIRLKGDLVSLTFLFLGFSFTDPNIDYILSRIKNLLGQSTPTHYCILKQPQPPRDTSPQAQADYEYELRKLALRVDDLKRFGIQTVLINSYDEITNLLRELNRRAFFNNIFVSGSAVRGTLDFDIERLLNFARKLGQEIIRRGYNVVSGYGVGVGAELLVGALEGAYLSPSSMRERLILRPFPRAIDEDRKQQVYRDWRKSMVSLAGFSIFLAGNKVAPGNKAEVILGLGVMEEFEVSTTPPIHSYPIPVGATGFVAKQIWEQVRADFNRFFGPIDVACEMDVLGDAGRTDEELMEAIFTIIEKIRSGQPK